MRLSYNILSPKNGISEEPRTTGIFFCEFPLTFLDFLGDFPRWMKRRFLQTIMFSQYFHYGFQFIVFFVLYAEKKWCHPTQNWYLPNSCCILFTCLQKQFSQICRKKTKRKTRRYRILNLLLVYRDSVIARFYCCFSSFNAHKFLGCNLIFKFEYLHQFEYLNRWFYVHFLSRDYGYRLGYQ